MGVEGDELTVDLVAARELGLVVRFERDHVEALAVDDDVAWILGGNLQALFDLPGGDVDHGDLILR